MYLLDTNIFLEMILEQERSLEVERLIRNPGIERLFLTDFSLHSICLMLLRQDKIDLLRMFVYDLHTSSSCQLIHLGIRDMNDILVAQERFSLDFDDAYQYIAAEKYDLTIISLDSDFDRTERGRKTPVEVL